MVDAREEFLAVVRLHDLWWGPGTYETRRQNSERCLKVLEGDLDLSKNDLDDWFAEQFLSGKGLTASVPRELQSLADPRALWMCLGAKKGVKPG